MLKHNGKMRGLYLRGEVYWFSKQINGRRSVVSLETKDYVEAVQRAQEILERPELQPALALSTEIQRFIKYQVDTNRYSRASVIAKKYVFSLFADSVQDVPPSKVTVQQCNAFYKGLRERIAPATAVNYMFAIRSFFNWCVKENLCHRNPILGMELDRVDEKARTHFADLELAQSLIAKAPDEDMRFILYCGFHVGMRKQEIIEAVPEWFNLDARVLEIRQTANFRPKDRNSRTVPLTDQFVEFLKGYGLRAPYVLKPEIAAGGASLYRFNFDRQFRQYMQEQGVPWLSPHIMRHSFASICASKGIDIYRIATWLGDDVRMVQQHYAKLRPDDREIMRAFKV